ncbi:MAG: hypothetical protein HQL77_14120 [Magnetococcales bacterium]|nr:hypothetical protein [Magnetococcales bacterium]
MAGSKENRRQPNEKGMKPDNGLVFPPSILGGFESMHGDYSNGSRVVDNGGDDYSKIPIIISKGKKWLLTAETAWAATIRGNKKKVSNIVGGLSCLLYSNDKPTISEECIINDSMEFLVSNTTESGLEAMSLGLPAVHCTAMALFIINKMIEKEKLSCSGKLEKSIKLMKESLINSASDIGWGFENRVVDEINIFRLWSTLWALRALNSTYSTLESRVKDKIRKICSRIVHLVPNMALGFTFNDEKKVSISALFVIFISELCDLQLKKELEEKSEFRNALAFILSGLNSSRHVEVEEYAYARKNIEKLSWSHVSAGLGIHALSLNKIFLSPGEKKILENVVNNIIKSNFRHIDDNVGYFHFDLLSSDKNDYVIFPTAEMIVGLYFYIHS